MTFETEEAALLSAGWTKLNGHRMIWLAPGDVPAPLTKKWSINAAYQHDLITLLPARRAAAAAKRKTAAAKKSGRRKTAAKD